MLLKPSPRRPSVSTSETKDELTAVASSTAWLVTVTPPTVTVSVPTVPDAELPSPNIILNLSPASVSNVEDAEGLNAVWPDLSFDGSDVEKTHKSDDPVSWRVY